MKALKRDIHTNSNAIKGARSSSPLGMTQGGNPSIETKTISQHVLDILGTNGVEIFVVCTLCNDHDGFSFPNFTML